MSARIYLDHAATTPIVPAARAAMAEAMERWANPSSPHAEGRAARRALEDARDRVRKVFDWDGDVIFTASVTEAAGLAFAKSKTDGARIAMSAVEHDALRRQVGIANVTELPVSTDGTVFQEAVDRWLPVGDGGLIAVQHVNSETGVIQPLHDVASKARDAGVTLVADCAQSAGKLKLPQADIILIGGHKFGGPPGAAALLVKDLRLLAPTGGQERGYRGGTENLPAIVGMAAALESRPAARQDAAIDRLRTLRDRLEQALNAHRAFVVGRSAPRSPLIGAYAMPGMSAQAQLIRLDGLGFAVSAGSACSSGSMKASHVLEAMSLDAAIAARTIRVSFSLDTTAEEVDAFADAWIALAADAARRAA